MPTPIPAPASAATSRDAKSTEEYRSEARVTIKRGETRSRVGGGAVQLIRLVLATPGPMEGEDGTLLERPDAICTLAPAEARRCAIELLQAAERVQC
jgi:hypothetical protein